MKRTILLSLAFIAICITPSCKKIFNSKTIVIGDTKGMIVTTYDSTFLPYSHRFDVLPYYELYSCGKHIDLNGDGVDDIRLLSSTGSIFDYQNLDFYTETKIERCNYTGFSCKRDIRGRYIHPDTTDIILGDTIQIYRNVTISCERVSEDDIHQEYGDYSSAIPYYKGDLLTKDDFYKEDYLLIDNIININTQPIVYSDEFYSIEKSTLTHTTYYEELDCSNFPLDIENYLAFKITENDGDEKLGWIKFILISQPDGTHRLRLLETAIQE